MKPRLQVRVPDEVGEAFAEMLWALVTEPLCDLCMVVLDDEEIALCEPCWGVVAV